jgi:putative tricarboxylic transport membrane protein
MDMFLSALFQLFQWSHFPYLMFGTILGLTLGILPGLGGTSGLAILLPFVYTFEPSVALAMMIGVLAPTTTSDTFPAVLLGIPGTAGSQATVLDGHPLAKRGEAARALSAAFLSSLTGGLFGAVILSISILFAKPIIMAFGFGEQFLLILLALLMIGALTGANFLKGIASCFVGLVIGTIGLAQITGDPRFTFGTLYLRDGFPLIVMGLGLFAVPEIVGLLKSRTSIAGDSSLKTGWLQGMQDVLKNWSLVLRCSTVGVLVGALPGLGGTVVDWIAYSHAKQTIKNPETLGTGDIRGVIAPESANNAKEGGALIPTILFGIPGSGNKVLLLGGLTLVGIEPGLEMVTTQLDVTYLIIWSLAVANVFGAGMCIFLAKPMAQLTRVPFYILAPVLIALIFFATFNANREWIDFFALMAFGAIGVIFKTFGWSRPALLIGFFLASKIELLSYQANAAYGWSFLTRTGSLILIAFALATMIFLIRQKSTDVSESDTSDQKIQLIFTALLAVFPTTMIFSIIDLDYRASIFPIALSAFLLLLLISISLLQILRLNKAGAELVGSHTILKILSRNVFENDGNLMDHLRAYTILPVFFGLVFLLGFPIATVALINGFILMHDRTKYLISGSISAVVLIVLWTMSSALTLQYPAGIIANLISLPWWLGGLY